MRETRPCKVRTRRLVQRAVRISIRPLSLSNRFERVLGLCADILKRNIQLYHSFVSLSV